MDPAAIQQAIADARRRRTPRGSFAAEGPLSLEAAYEVQVRMAREREAQGDGIAGYKLGLLSPGKQQQMGVSEPILGHLHRSMAISPGEPVVAGRFIQPRVEPELAVVFARDVGAGARRGQVLAALDFALLVVDVLDSVYDGYRFTAGDVVADNASGGAVILGGRPLPADVLFDGGHRLRLSVDGQTWQEGALSQLGDAAGWIAWAADKAAALGRGVRRGDLLLLGAPCAAVPLPTAGAVVAEGPLGTSLIAPIA
ncbi:MAG: fumarylacetoacetate hydrolase family protein [Limnochordales bacterium]|nr:fumarylacetoacetate hydrolase family protein [Limnochordales bacterium]